MITRKTCQTPGCNNLAKRRLVDPFCKSCRKEHSLFVLRLQAEHGKSINDIIMDAKIFQNAQGMADYVGVSFVTLYNWIDRYFGMTFQEFRRKFICRSAKCWVLDTGRCSLVRSDYLLSRIRGKGKCACTSALESSLIMTNAPLEFVGGLLKDAPRLVQVSDKCFALATSPIKFKMIEPVYIRPVRAIKVFC
jgi:hypothetical protein